MKTVVDQRDVQRLGGRAHRYPSSYVVVKLLEEHGLMNSVLDVTYGRGRFWYYKRPKLLVGADPKVWEWVVAPDIFIPKPVWALRPILEKLGVEFDVIVVDPPFNIGVSYNKRDEYSYILGTPRMIVEEAVKLAKHLGINYMLLHYSTTVELPIVENVEFRYVTRYLSNPNYRTTFFTLYRVG